VALMPVVFLLPAGRIDWIEAWLLSGVYALWAVALTTMLARHDPELLRERMKASPVQAGQLGWDAVLMVGMLVVGLALLVVPGLDVVRLQWSEPLPVWLEAVGLIAHVPLLGAVMWVMWTNTFLARVVKVDASRGHQVITHGPYAIVRHPMYAAVIPMLFAMPVALGSRWGLVPAAVMAVLLVVRTALEDRALHADLEGYADYARQTRYRLLPGVW
jgi:protein-S-isoprenylcysteine O-methyltransferase Ste14